MSIDEEFRAVELRALRDNTAQDVFNNLKDLVNHASLHASRWIWELLQNARDAANPESPLHVAVSVGKTALVFRHDGMAFTMDQVAHLIHHGSTKQEGQIGRFGTGFLSTHIISKVPRVSGRLSDGRGFSFVLDRTGGSPKELSESMERSSGEFRRSVATDTVEKSGHSTSYEYPLADDVREIAHQGVASLEAYAPYVLAFNHEIESVEIVVEGQGRVYNRQPARRLGDEKVESAGESAVGTEGDGEQDEHAGDVAMTTQVDVESSAEDDVPPYLVAALTGGQVTVALLARLAGDTRQIVFGPEVPRFFMAFPLFGTEGMGYPGVVNSRNFRPQKDRDGLYLGPEKTDDNAANKGLIEKACPLFVSLLEQCASAGWAGIDLLCRLTTTTPRGVDEKWLHPLVGSALVAPLRAEPLVATCGGGLIAAEDAWIPLSSPAVPSSSLWLLLRDRASSDEWLVSEGTAASWEANVRAWASVLGVAPEEMQEGYKLTDFADKLAEFGSTEKVREALRAGCDPVAWCNRVFGLLMQAGLTPLFDKLALLPDQHGAFRRRNSLRLDNGIDGELKDIGEALGVPVRSGLLHQDVASTGVRSLFQEKTQREVLTEITGHLGAEAAKARPVPGFRRGNVRLFAWILKHGAHDYLKSFPALTQVPVGEGEAQHVVALTEDGEPDAVPLAPPECWPEGARKFAPLFPVRHVLSSEYHAAGPERESWASAAGRGFVRLNPIFDVTEHVEEFLPDDTLTDDETHRSKKPVRTTEIAFLQEKDVGLMDMARKNQNKCLLLLRFLGAYMIRTDRSWDEPLAVDCECGKTHNYLKAGWVVPLKPKKKKWIYVGRNHSDYLSVDSLARLLKDEREIVSLLAEGDGPAFLAVLGVSAGDFLMRSATSDEPSRVALSKSVVQMLQAVGGDIGQMSDLAQEITDHPQTIKEIRERRAIRRKVKQNQDVGRAVEQAFRSALGTGHGLKVERAPVGSDYSIEPEFDYLDEGGQEVLLRIDKFYIEIKATVGQHVRMTEVQGKKARDNSTCYALCVMVLSGQDEEITEATIREKAKFVTDIGDTIRPLVESVESLEGSKKGVVRSSGSIEVEMQDQAVKFKVGHEVWKAGIGFDEAVQFFGGSTAPASVATAVVLEPGV